MNLDEFLHKLHYETDKIIPSDWEVNWEDAPLPFKLYRDLPFVELPANIPFQLEQIKRNTKPTFKEIIHFLKFTYGLTQVSETFFGDQKSPFLVTRRFVPSGGALYPNEIYLYLKINELPEGIYHYDAAHHRLVTLREGNFDGYLKRALGDRCDVSSTFCTVFVTTYFWKNFFKYHNFSYRLQGLDAGFVIGQLLEASNQTGLNAKVFYHFLDQAINHLIGLNHSEESVYAVISLSTELIVEKNCSDESITAKALCLELEPLHHNHYVRSKEIRDYPMLRKMNEASFIDSFPALQTYSDELNQLPVSDCIKLPTVSKLNYDVNSTCQNRYSPGLDFVLKPISIQTLSALLYETGRLFYQNDLDDSYRVSLALCTYQIDGVPNGAYAYDHLTHALLPIKAGDFRKSLQDGLLSDFVNTMQIPLSFNLIGDQGHYKRSYGYRGHRIQHMEAGILAHRLVLTASALQLGGHPILGFDVRSYDELFKLNEKGKTSLLQIPVGYYRRGIRDYKDHCNYKTKAISLNDNRNVL